MWHLCGKSCLIEINGIQTMKVKRLTMQAFRGIGDLTLEFDTDEPIVFIGVNGVGKSSIVDCLAILLSWLLARIQFAPEVNNSFRVQKVLPLVRRGGELVSLQSPIKNGRNLSEQDINNKTNETHNEISIVLEKTSEVRWSIGRIRKNNGEEIRNNFEELIKITNEIRNRWQNNNVDTSHIEHLKPRKHYPELALEYRNLLASCQAERDKNPPPPIRCGHKKGDWYDECLMVSPLHGNCQDFFTYSGSGEILPTDEPDKQATAETTIEILGLNIDKLIAMRREAIEGVLLALRLRSGLTLRGCLKQKFSSLPKVTTNSTVRDNTPHFVPRSHIPSSNTSWHKR